MNTRVHRVGRQYVLVCRPHSEIWAHQAIEITYALSYARLMDLSVLIIRPRTMPSTAVFEVTTSEVRILDSRRERLIPRLVAAFDNATDSVRQWRRGVAMSARHEMSRELRRRMQESPLPPRAKMRVKSRLAKVKENYHRDVLKRDREREARMPLQYNRRRLVAKPISTSLREPAERRALEVAAEFGLGPDSKVVCVHARERGYKQGAEMQDKRRREDWDDSVRNAHIEAYLPAIDYLADRGFTVVRMGDPTMLPVRRPGVLDLATAEGPEQDLRLLQMWALMQASFLVAAESGPLSVTYLTDTPSLVVNATDPIGAFPIRPDSVYLLKTIVDRRSGEALLPSALLTEERLSQLRSPEWHQFVENTPQQIVDAVVEMLDLLDNGAPESASQAWYRKLVTDAATRFDTVKYVRKHGADRGFMGDGRLVSSLADRWFADDGESTRARETAAVG